MSADGACTCKYGCSRCGYPEAMMGNCAAVQSCPVGRAPAKDCPVHPQGINRLLRASSKEVQGDGEE